MGNACSAQPDREDKEDEVLSKARCEIETPDETAMMEEVDDAKYLG
jgi:hypothetical protein